MGNAWAGPARIRVLLVRTWNYGEAVVIRQLLASYGIHCQVDSDIPQTVLPVYFDGLGEVRIWVAAHRDTEARRLLADHRRQGLRLIRGGKPQESVSEDAARGRGGG